MKHFKLVLNLILNTADSFKQVCNLYIIKIDSVSPEELPVPLRGENLFGPRPLIEILQVPFRVSFKISDKPPHNFYRGGPPRDATS